MQKRHSATEDLKLDQNLATAAPSQDLFKLPRGDTYRAVLEAVHVRRKPKWYLEIGTCKGHSLSFVTCASIAIDPAFQLGTVEPGKKPFLIMMQQTSDAAFASDIMKQLNPAIDIAFLDGMHKFEYLLRDFINAEQRMAKNGLIFMHDTSPHSLAMAKREPSGLGGWTGDVWKLLPILRKFRPDLQIDHLDCRKTGLTLVRGDWGSNDALVRNYDSIVADYMDMTLADYGADTYFSTFPLVPCWGVVEQL